MQSIDNAQDTTHDCDFQDIEFNHNFGTLDDNGDIEESDSDVECEESSQGETDPDDKRDEAISNLENLALSFLSQLTASLKPKSRKDSSDASSSQPSTSSAPNRIVLGLANRRKTCKSGGSITEVRSVQFPKKMKGPSARATAQLLRVANEAHDALVNQSPITKRDLFYRDVSLFKSQATVDALVDDLAATFSINRSDLNVRASSKGLYCGSALTIHLCDGTTIAGHNTELVAQNYWTQAVLIPNAQDIDEFQIDEEVAWILVVEKDAVFQTLCGAGLTNHPRLTSPGILVTGKGYPDLATRQLVKTLSDNLPEKTRILALVDADAYGLDIVSIYKYGSTSMRHENESLVAERLEWVGVSATEALSLGVDRDVFLPITSHDQRKALSLLRSSNQIPLAWKRELMQMLHTRRKAETEILSSLSFSSKPENHDEADGSGFFSTKLLNPLVGYVIWKISNALLR